MTVCTHRGHQHCNNNNFNNGCHRDGVLKFMFRIADVRNAQVVEPKVLAYLYTWGDGRTTAEGEYLPFRADPLSIGYVDGMLLLPLTIEHTIDERSPLYGHTYDTLMVGLITRGCIWACRWLHWRFVRGL